MAIEFKYGTTLGGTITPNNPGNMTDLSFNNLYGNFLSADGDVVYTALQDTTLLQADLTTPRLLQIKFYVTADYSNDTMSIDIYDGSSWQVLETYDNGNQPPQVGTLVEWDVSTILDTIAKINAAQVRFTCTVGGAPDATVYVDEVRLKLKTITALEELWGHATLGGTLSPTNPQNAVDEQFNDLIADWTSADGTVIWNDIEDTVESDDTIIETVLMDVRFRAQAVLTDDTLVLEYWDGVAWQIAETFNSGNQPPTTLTTKQYDITANINTFTKINGLQVRWTNTKVGGGDTDFEIDEVLIQVKKRNVIVNENVTVAENVNLVLQIDINISENLNVIENISANLDVLNVNVLDPFHVLITESISVVDLIVEVGVVMEAITVVNQFVSINLDVLNIDVYESISAVDYLIDAITSSGELPYSFQTGAFYDGTYYWRGWFNRTGGYIQFEYTQDPDGTWTENVNARITDSNARNNFSLSYANNKIYAVYDTTGGVIKVREATPSTTFSWSAATTVYMDVTKTYSSPEIEVSGAGYIWVVATELNGSNQYAVVKESTNIYDITAWGSLTVLGDTGNTEKAFSAIIKWHDTLNKVVCLYTEGQTLQLKAYSGSAWDVSSTFVATIKISSQSLVAHQFDGLWESLNSNVSIIYIKSDGTLIHRHWNGTTLEAEEVLDSGSNNEHPSIGYYFSDYYEVVTWDKTSDGTTNIHYVLENVQTGIWGSHITLDQTSNIIVRTTSSENNNFITWEESNSVQSRAIGLGTNVYEDISIVENVQLLDIIIELSTYENINLVEYFSIYIDNLFISIEDSISITEYIDTVVFNLFVSVNDTISVVENLAIDTSYNIYKEIYDTVFIQELVFIETTAIIVEVSDFISVTEYATLFDIVIEVESVFDLISISESIILFPDELFIFGAVDTITVTESVITHDIVIELSAIDIASVSEDVTILLPILNIDAEDIISITELGVVGLSGLNIGAFDIVMTSDHVDVLDLSVEIGVLGHIIKITENLQMEILGLNYINLNESVIIQENVELELRSYISVSDTVAITEYWQGNPDPLFVSIGEDLLITEAISILDIIVEVGIVANVIAIQEQAIVELDNLFLNIYDEIAIVEVPGLSIPNLYLSVFDSIGIAEYVDISVNPLIIDISDNVTISDNALLDIITISLSVYDDISVIEYANVFDIVIELFAIDYISLSDIVITTGLEGIVVGDGVSVNGALVDYLQVEDIAFIEPILIEINVFEAITINEYANIFDIIIEIYDAYEDISITEVLDIVLPELNIFEFENITIIEFFGNFQLIEINEFEIITIVERNVVRGDDFRSFPRKVFNVNPRTRIFTVEIVR